MDRPPYSFSSTSSGTKGPVLYCAGPHCRLYIEAAAPTGNMLGITRATYHSARPFPDMPSLAPQLDGSDHSDSPHRSEHEIALHFKGINWLPGYPVQRWQGRHERAHLLAQLVAIDTKVRVGCGNHPPVAKITIRRQHERNGLRL